MARISDSSFRPVLHWALSTAVTSAVTACAMRVLTGEWARRWPLQTASSAACGTLFAYSLYLQRLVSGLQSGNAEDERRAVERLPLAVLHNHLRGASKRVIVMAAERADCSADILRNNIYDACWTPADYAKFSDAGLLKLFTGGGQAWRRARGMEDYPDRQDALFRNRLRLERAHVKAWHTETIFCPKLSDSSRSLLAERPYINVWEFIVLCQPAERTPLPEPLLKPVETFLLCRARELAVVPKDLLVDLLGRLSDPALTKVVRHLVSRGHSSPDLKWVLALSQAHGLSENEVLQGLERAGNLFPYQLTEPDSSDAYISAIASRLEEQGLRDACQTAGLEQLSMTLDCVIQRLGHSFVESITAPDLTLCACLPDLSKEARELVYADFERRGLPDSLTPDIQRLSALVWSGHFPTLANGEVNALELERLVLKLSTLLRWLQPSEQLDLPTSRSELALLTWVKTRTNIHWPDAAPKQRVVFQTLCSLTSTPGTHRLLAMVRIAQVRQTHYSTLWYHLAGLRDDSSFWQPFWHEVARSGLDFSRRFWASSKCYNRRAFDQLPLLPILAVFTNIDTTDSLDQHLAIPSAPLEAAQHPGRPDHPIAWLPHDVLLLICKRLQGPDVFALARSDKYLRWAITQRHSASRYQVFWGSLCDRDFPLYLGEPSVVLYRYMQRLQAFASAINDIELTDSFEKQVVDAMPSRLAHVLAQQVTNEELHNKLITKSQE